MLLSSTGEYVRTDSGVLRWTHSGLPRIDVEQWQPRFMFWQRFQKIDGRSIVRGDILGYFYAPLISLDQRFIHPTRRLHDPRPVSSRDVSALSSREEVIQKKSTQAIPEQSPKDTVLHATMLSTRFKSTVRKEHVPGHCMSI